MNLTAEQKEALGDVERLARRSAGAILLDRTGATERNGWLRIPVLLSSASLVPDRHGVMMRTSEPIMIVVPPAFPFVPPDAYARHTDFAGLPHVQWGTSLCLYASAADWDASAGMAGFLRQLVSFYTHLAHGTLDGPEMPWHPPVAYTGENVPCLIVRADLARPARRVRRATFRWALGMRPGAGRVELVQWLERADLDPASPFTEQKLLDLLASPREKDPHQDLFLIPSVQLPRPLAFEYPEDLEAIALACEALGLATSTLLAALDLATDVNLSVLEPDSEFLPDLFLLLRAPGTRRAGGNDLPAHFAAWHFSSSSPRYEQSPDDYDPRWSAVYDARATVIKRRDQTRPVARLLNRRVLLLGCGALGRPIAEACVRAGVNTLTVADNGEVSPGLLVRQNYTEDDIGQGKAEVLARDLRRIRHDVSVDAHTVDLRACDLLAFDALCAYDLIIDATAEGSIAARLELARKHDKGRRPALLTVGIDSDASTGLVTVSPPGTRGGAVELLRHLYLTTLTDEDDADVHERFFAVGPTGNPFEPEPGCSSSTFVGSYSDVMALAAQMLNAGLDGLQGIGSSGGEDRDDRVLVVTPDGQAQRSPQAGSACIVRSSSTAVGVRRRIFPQPEILPDAGHRGYEIRLAPDVLDKLLTLAASDTTTTLVSETGGLLLGHFDHACRVVWVSEVTDLPSGSTGTPFGLLLNAPEAIAHTDLRAHDTKGAVRRIGYWHTHPHGPTAPSQIDRSTMRAEQGRQQLMLILGGSPSTNADISAEVFFA